VSVTATVTVLVFIVSLLPAARLGRRVLEVRSRERATGVAMVARSTARLWVRGPVVRSLFMFGVSSLVRSRRHTVQLATYFGMAIAVGVLKLLPPLLSLRGSLVLDAPRAYTISVPLVLVFFAVFGLRAAFTIPTELDANWVFRLVQPTVRESLRASRWLIVMLGVAPVSLGWLLFTLAMWPTPTALGASALVLVTGLLLTELALSNWTKVPFCQRPRARDRDAQIESRLVHHFSADVPVHPLRAAIPRSALVDDNDDASCSRGDSRHRDSHLASAHAAIAHTDLRRDQLGDDDAESVGSVVLTGWW
jgi:hypothetical protein